MKKTIIIIAIILVVLSIGVIALISGDKNQTGIKLETAEEMIALVEKIYTKTEMPLQSLQTAEIDITDTDMLNYYTGLKSNENIKNVVVSEPMMTSQAYSLVMVKAEDNADIEAIKQEMVDNIDTMKWVCVTAEKLYATNSGNIIFLVMSTEELAKPVYEAFKTEAGEVGKELQRTEEVTEMPDEIL